MRSVVKICVLILSISVLVGCSTQYYGLSLSDDGSIILSSGDEVEVIADASDVSLVYYAPSVYDSLNSNPSYKQKHRSEAYAVIERILENELQMKKTDVSFENLASGCEIRFSFYNGSELDVYVTRSGELYLLNGSEVYVSDKNAVDPTPYIGYMN